MTGIHVHRSDRPQELAAGLATILADNPADVFSSEVVVVPARGVERWLTQQLSHTLGSVAGDDGICAGLEILTPSSLVGLLLDRDRDDPWSADRLVWPTLDAIDELGGTPGFEAITRHLGAGPEIVADPAAEWDRKARRARRYVVARRIAGLFVAYHRDRPQMLGEWESGSSTDGYGSSLADDLMWQPPLWRRVVELTLDAHGLDESVTGRHQRVVAGLRDGSLPLELPERLSFFGYTRLARAERELIQALGSQRELHLWLPHPSPALWDAIGSLGFGASDSSRWLSRTDELANPYAPKPRSEDETALVAENPLLATLGRDVRELQQTLVSMEPVLHEPLSSGSSAASRLASMQADVRGNTAPTSVLRDVPVVSARGTSFVSPAAQPAEHGGRVVREGYPPSAIETTQDDIEAQPAEHGGHAPTPLVEPGRGDEGAASSAETKARLTDNSFQVHSCHGRPRQVGVLREVLTWLLAEGKGDLQPRDILVMCPDIEAFAPLLRATFGLSNVSSITVPDHDAHPGQRLRLQLADRSPGATNPLFDLARRVVAIVAGRMTASEVLDLAGHESVRRRFGFDDDSLSRIAAWVEDADVRWGFDELHRREYGLRGFDAHTWTPALDRIALGVAISADADGPDAIGAPVDDIGSRDIEVAGRFLELMERIKRAADDVRGRGEHLTSTDGNVQTAQWMNWLKDIVHGLADVPLDDRWQLSQIDRELDTIAASAGEVPLRLSDIRTLLDQRWAGRPTRANFRTGAITVCSMVPMRSVPHKAVVVLGLDDGVYPRSPVVDGDDVLARRPFVGERDPRSEDRQLLLDAVMAADDYFVAIYSGANEHNGARRPPAVPLQELIAVATRTGGGDDSFVHLHPLQAFDERNFTAASPLPGGTFDRSALAGAKALRRFRHDQPPQAPFLSGLLPARPLDAVTIDELTGFLHNPARDFLRSRLGIFVPREADPVDDAVPIALDGLQTWAIGERMLQQMVQGATLDEVMQRENRRSSFPPGALGDKARKDVQGELATITKHLHRPDDVPPRSVDVRLDLPGTGGPGSVRFTGVVGGVHGDELRVHTFSRIGPKQLISGWVRLLALAAVEPDRTHHATLHGKRGSVRLSSPGAQEASTLLADLVELRGKGLQYPMTVPPRTAHAFVRGNRVKLLNGDDNLLLHFASTEWEGDKIPGENTDPYWVKILGRGAPIQQIEMLGLRQFSARIWLPVLTHQEDA